MRIKAFRVMCGAVLISAMVMALPAGAAPARTTALDSVAREFKWSHGPVTAIGTDYAHPMESAPFGMCHDPGYPCDDTLIELKEAGGKLVLNTVSDEELPDGVRYRPDIDIFLYKSDANGTVGALAGESATPDASERITLNKAPAGFYLLRVAYWSGVNVSYDGTATFTPPPPPVAVAAP